MCLALKATGSVLLHLQWDGRTEQRKLGLSVRTSSPAWSARTSTTFLVSGLDLRGPGVAMAPLLSPILLQGKDVEGGVNRLVVGGSTGICITTAWVSATWLGCIRRAGLLGRKTFFLFFVFLSLFLQTWMVSGVHRVSVKDGGERAPSQEFNRNNTLWWLFAISSMRDASAWGTSGFLYVSLFWQKKLQSSSQCWTRLISALLSVGQFQPRVHGVSTPQTTSALALKSVNESLKYIYIYLFFLLISVNLLVVIR